MLATLLIQLASQNLDKVWQDDALKGAIVGACVVDESGKQLYARNADLLMIPASNQKLVTAAIALKNLGPDYRPLTNFWKLHDAIYVESTGDPDMSHDDLLKIREQLKIGRARNVVIHSAYGSLLPPGWEWDDLPNKYAAPVSAFSVDRSSFELWTEKGKLFFLPEAYGATAIYHGGEGATRDVFDPKTMVANVYGKLPQERTRLDTLAIGAPDMAAASILGRNPKKGSMIMNELPTLIWHGKPLVDILKDELPTSDNNVSENLLLMSEHVSADDVDPYSVADERIAKDLDQIGIHAEEIKVSDGSGLSRHNVVTPNALAKLLVWADQQPTKELWHSCLAKPGEEGTLKNRLAGVPFEGKTGTMDKVSALSGYLHLNNGKELIVVILVNDYLCSTAETRDLEDAFIKNVLAAGNEGTLFAESYNYAGPRPYARTCSASYYWLR